MSSSLCKKERGYPLSFRIVVKEYRIKNSFHTIFVTENAHRSGSSLDLFKGSFNEVSRGNARRIKGQVSAFNKLSF